mgnify:CR=1 FL=1|tara:strand:- start:884 stop:1228 length:345 start_codon:yes stop_codon:yes gene_type:complete
MAFVLDQEDSYSWPCRFEVPVSGGKYKVMTFDAEFKNIKQSRLEELMNLQSEGKKTDTDIAKEMIVGWSGIVDGKGEEIPFTEKAKKQLLDIAGMGSQLTQIFVASRSKAKAKN